MKIVKVSALPMSAPVPRERRHRTDLGTKVKSDATLIRVETDDGLTGIGAALGTPPIVAKVMASYFKVKAPDPPDISGDPAAADTGSTGGTG